MEQGGTPGGLAVRSGTGPTGQTWGPAETDYRRGAACHGHINMPRETDFCVSKRGIIYKGFSYLKMTMCKKINEQNVKQ